MLAAQTVDCGTWQLAFNLAWTTQVLERFVLSTVPRAPHWLAGCTNVEGVVIPVVDLQAFVTADESQDLGVGVSARQQRLLVGSASRPSAEETLAILFSGLPGQVSYFRKPLDDTKNLPPRLLDICRGEACCVDGRRLLEIDTQRLCEVLSLHAAPD